MLPDENTHLCSVCVSRFATNCVMAGFSYRKIAVFCTRRSKHVPVFRKGRFRVSSGGWRVISTSSSESLVSLCQNTRRHRSNNEQLTIFQ